MVRYSKPELVVKTLVDREDRSGALVEEEYRNALPKDELCDMMRSR